MNTWIEITIAITGFLIALFLIAWLWIKLLDNEIKTRDDEPMMDWDGTMKTKKEIETNGV